ncbi:hypothetical protein C6P40_000897 [Pichia californica]|uniref:Uncharacterized protein n=1 Tax=Pichia californica TaxID=460514 RepID=A0A9P7BDS9_9ASCO|nr:hypothetical protein C6P40_000897 [[Candida] californica]
MDLYNKEKNSKPNSKASSNGINISFDGYTYDPYFQDKLEPILKELTGLRYFPQNDDFEENTLNLDENGKRNENPFQNNFQLSGTQLIYKYVTWMVTLATTLVTPSSEMIEKVGSSQKDIFSSPSHFLEALQTAGSVFML